MNQVAVYGMARSGVAAAEVLVRQGSSVVCIDQRPDAPVVPGTVQVYGGDARAAVLAADAVVVSPGVPASHADLVAAVAAGIPVIGELAWAASQIAAPILAVSGTNGKSTTTHLLGQLCGNAGLRTFTGGNIGVPLSSAIGTPWDVVVVEVSSYQMEFPGEFRPHAAAILNLTPDHLERHGSLENYGAHKCRMFARMGPNDAAIVPANDPRLIRLANAHPGRRAFLGDSPGVRIDGDALRLDGIHDPGEVSLAGFPLPGRHNRENIAAAALLALSAGLWRRDLSVSNLQGLPHRMQIIADISGVRWIDDSKATNVEAALAAYSGLEGPFIALLGGRGKAGAGYEAMGESLRRARAIHCFGEDGAVIRDALALADLKASVFPRMVDAVGAAAAVAKDGDAVVLSPACASFDEFANFEHRGRVFQALVEGMRP